MWHARKTTKKPTLTGWVVLLIPYTVISAEQKDIVYIFIRRLEAHWHQLYFIFHWYFLQNQRLLTNSYLLVQFSCMAGTSQLCNYVRKALCLPDFVCFFCWCSLSIILKYYTRVVYGTIFGVNIYITVKEELPKNYYEICVQRVHWYMNNGYHKKF